MTSHDRSWYGGWRLERVQVDSFSPPTILVYLSNFYLQSIGIMQNRTEQKLIQYFEARTSSLCFPKNPTATEPSDFWRILWRTWTRRNLAAKIQDLKSWCPHEGHRLSEAGCSSPAHPTLLPEHSQRVHRTSHHRANSIFLSATWSCEGYLHCPRIQRSTANRWTEPQNSETIDT